MMCVSVVRYLWTWPLSRQRLLITLNGLGGMTKGVSRPRRTPVQTYVVCCLALWLTVCSRIFVWHAVSSVMWRIRLMMRTQLASTLRVRRWWVLMLNESIHACIRIGIRRQSIYNWMDMNKHKRPTGRAEYAGETSFGVRIYLLK